MAAVRLGRIGLRWCDSCNVPLVELDVCGLCGGPTHTVEITPPGDYRPAFPHDLERMRKTINDYYGPGCGAAMIPKGRLAVLNKCPSVDLMDELVTDGAVLGSHMFEPGAGWRFICRLEGAQRIAESATKHWAMIDDGAVPSIRKGASSMAVGILDADPGIRVGDEVIVMTQDRKVVSTGRARMSGPDMVRLDRGPAVKSRWYKGTEPLPEMPEGRTWRDAVLANSKKLEKKRRKSVEHIRRTANMFGGLPVAVSVSGGKDSLATLLLVLEAGLRPKLIFTDTGLEFPETLENVRRTAERYGLELIAEHADGAFWRALEHFGPPAKDFRWCCKTCKLGPMAKLIREHFPDGVLSFIGQRQYESSQRYEKGNVWRNPWVPGQVGASPIQNWPSLLVWLYLFQQGAEYNQLYERGLERIGCWLCPATDMGEFADIEKYAETSGLWQQALSRFAEERGLPPEWRGYGLWRWKVLPKGMLDFLRENGIEAPTVRGPRPGEAQPTAAELARLERFSCISDDAYAVRMKALRCMGCGICVSVCGAGALRIERGRVEVDPEKCTGCGKCLHPCVVVDFEPR